MSAGPEIANAAQRIQTDGSHVESLEVDLAEYDGVETLYRTVQSTGEPVNAIVMNADVGVYGDFARESDLKDERKLIDVNATSVGISSNVGEGHGGAGRRPHPVHIVRRIRDTGPSRRTTALRRHSSTVIALMPGDGDEFCPSCRNGRYQALMAGKDHVVAGSLRTPCRRPAARVLPDTLMAEVHRKMAEPAEKQK